MTLAGISLVDIIGAIAFILLIAIIAAIFDAFRSEGKPDIAYELIPSDKNMDIIGDGAWIVTPAEYPKTDRIFDMQEPMGM